MRYEKLTALKVEEKSLEGDLAEVNLALLQYIINIQCQAPSPLRCKEFLSNKWHQSKGIHTWGNGR